MIVDTTGATYGRVTEDNRKGWKREVIGIIPVVTTAANAMYAQNYINVGINAVNKFESLCGEALLTLAAKNPDGSWMSADGQNSDAELSTSGLSSTDLVPYIACDSHFHCISSVNVNVLQVDTSAQISIDTWLSTDNSKKRTNGNNFTLA